MQMTSQVMYYLVILLLESYGLVQIPVIKIVKVEKNEAEEEEEELPRPAKRNKLQKLKEKIESKK